MFVSERGEPADVAPAAFARLESALPSLRGRKFYGVFDQAKREYRACVTLNEDDNPRALGFSRGLIPGGRYLRARLLGKPNEVIPRIGDAFAAMAESGAADQSRHPVEFYRRNDSLDLLFPVGE